MTTESQALFDAMPMWIAVECPERLRPVIARKGLRGFYNVPGGLKTVEEVDAYLARLYGVRAPSQGERDAAWVGAHFGWHCTAADPLWWEMKHSRGVLDGKRDTR